MASGDLSFLSEDSLAEFVARQRWFGGKSQEVAGARVLETAPIVAEPPVLVSALVEVRFGAGTHEVYQLLLGLASAGERPEGEVVQRVDGEVAHDALGDPEHVAAIAHLIRTSAALPAGEGEMVFRNTAGAHAYGFEARQVRPIGVEQSNTSFVLDERLVLKAYRRVEPGVNPELELLRFLTDHGFPNVAGLVGWYGYTGPLMEATLGVLQRFVPDARDGWAVVQAMMDEGDPEPFVPMAGRLGEVTGAMHAALASDASDPAFAPAEPSAEAVAILAARIDDEVVELFANLPDLPVLAPIAGSGEAVRERVRRLPAALSGGRIIRQHGDYHLGQVLWAGGDWVVIDFEGEPARPITERRRKRSPLRDAAGMLRSFAYAGAAYELRTGRATAPGWLERAREAFLSAYLPPVDAMGLLPPSLAATEELLRIFELEKAVYELRYELGHRPEWVAIAVAGIQDLIA